MLSREPHLHDLPADLAAWLMAIPAPQGSIGWQAAAASVLESAFFKPGNVYPGARFSDLCHDDFLAAAYAIAAPFNRLSPNGSPGQPPLSLSHTVLSAVAASTAVTQSNANLGIVLALAPLAAATSPQEQPLQKVLSALNADDAAAIWQAIALAQPGGLGRVDRHDLTEPAPPCILEAMQLARERDAIAQLWADNYRPLFSADPAAPGMVPLLEQAISTAPSLEAAILEAFLTHLANHHDTLIARRHGPAVAATVSQQAAEVLSTPEPQRATAVRTWDTALRRGRWHDGQQRPLNPGATADLLAAALFVLIRRGVILHAAAHDHPACEASLLADPLQTED